ncbi:MAG TPA: hypothetical protein VMR16_01235, partial [Candidatus Saccharimonadales bacterium]|nr:hypothetical protein [Candidatus Saccharimonadales bacterium]
MLQKKHKKIRVILSVLICLILIALSLLVIFNRQRVIDQITVWQFHSTSEINALVDRAGMNDNGKFLFLASQPRLDGSQDFNKECDRIESTTAILGCYSNYRIYVYDVTDKQLDGVREVTATHETLHAAYARLSTDEENRVNVLLEAEYKKLENNKDYSDRMAFYARTEPGERDSELHSVIGTEISNISPELEAYYAKYFSNRQKVVALNTKYMGVFINLKNHANDLSAQINTLVSSISGETTQYNNDVKVLNNDIIAFNARVSSGSFTTQAQLNSERSALFASVAELEATRKIINADITKYILST